MTPTPLIQTAINGPRVSERFESAGLPKNREGVETIRSELQSLQEIMRKKPERACEIFENLQKQIAGRQEIPPSVFTRINEAKKNYDEGSFQLSEQLVADLERSISPEPMSEALIQEHTEKAAAYLVNTLDRNNSVLNITGNIPGYNPFYGDLNAPALIRYRRENEEKNYSAEYAQEALRGLPIYEEDETTPKIYSAVAPNGGETRVIYWIPNNPAIKNFEGHWAMEGQMRDQRAFIPDGWEIREIEKPEEKMQIRYEMGQEKKEAPKTTKEIQEIKTRMNQLEKRKDAVKKLASELTAVLQREVAERTQGQPLQKGINESVIARYEANFEEIVQRAKAKKTATRAIPETIAQPRTVILDQKFSDGKISSSAIPRSGISQQVTLEKAITPTIETPEISETGAMAYMTELFEIVRRIFGAKTIPEGQKIASEKTQEAEQQAVEALITLEEIFASMKIAPSSEKTVSMNELFTTPIDVEVEIITKTRETLHSLRLAFDLDPSVINSLITNNS